MINVLDIQFMKQVLVLAVKGRGRVSPNPLVGAVVVKDGKIVGSGWHRKAGGPHAEIIALKQAAQKTKGATMFVSLEPCCHYGKTPPCTDAIIRAGIKKVVIAMKDPNPIVNGKGISKLRRSGVKVEVLEVNEGKIADEAARINEVFIKYVRTGMPFVIGKIASSLDGKIATSTGDSKWISNKKAREFVHKLRYEADAILVGKNTVMNDDPKLTARKNNKIIKRPYRIVLGGDFNFPPDRKIFQMRDGKTIVVVGKGANRNKKKKLEDLGVKIIEVTKNNAGRISLKILLKELGKMEITSLLVEGGSNTLTSFVREGLIDKMHHFVAPLMIGDNGISCVGGLGVNEVRKAYKLTNVEVKKFGDNVLFAGYPSKK